MFKIFRILICFLIFPSVAVAQEKSNFGINPSLEGASSLTDIYVVKYQKKSDERYKFGRVNVPPSQATESGELDYKKYFEADQKLQKDLSEGWKFYHFAQAPMSRHVFYILTNRTDLESVVLWGDDDEKKMNGGRSIRDAEFVEKKFENGEMLYNCSRIFNYVPDIRLYLFKKNDDFNDAFLWGLGKPHYFDNYKRGSFIEDFENFNKHHVIFTNPFKWRRKSDGNGEKVWKEHRLPEEKKYNARDISTCNSLGSNYVGFFSASNEYSGKSFRFKAHDFKVFWEKVQAFRKKGAYLVDINRTSLQFSDPMKDKQVVWYAVLSDNDAVNDRIYYKYYTSPYAMEYDIERVGEYIEPIDIEISTRGTFSVEGFEALSAVLESNN